MEKSCLRNETIDAVRGIAIILVMTGHIMKVNVAGFSESPIFNVIWSLQIPLFMIISGYVTKYAKPIGNRGEYYYYLGKRSLSYILPWVVWTIFVKVFLLGSADLLYITRIIFSMDSGYWFIFSLWTICIIFGTATYFTHKITQNKLLCNVITILFSIVLSLGLLVVGMEAGMNFLGIKLTLYYLPFFYLGYLYTIIEKEFYEKSWFKDAKHAAILLAIVIYVFIILRINLYSAEDTLTNIIIRITASISGCAVVFYTISQVFMHLNENIRKLIITAGRYSLELYIVHLLFTSIIDVTPMPEFLSVDGFVLCSINYILLILFSTITISIISANKWSNLFCFGKKEVKISKD